MKKILTLMISLLLVMTGCGKSANDKEIEVIAKGFTQQYWTAVKNGAEQAAEEYNVALNFVGPANETAIQEQVQMLSNAINKKPDAIALASLDTNSQIDLLNQAKDQEIPIVGFDSGVPSAPEGTVVATAATNNKEAAGIAAEKIFEELKEEVIKATPETPVKVGILSQEVNSQSISDRTEGFINKFEELSKEVVEYPVSIVGHEKFNNGVEEKEASVIIQVQVPANATDTEVQTSGQVLLKDELVKAVFTTNETATKGILNANDSVGNLLGKSVIAAGFDSGKMQKEAVKEKVLLGSVTQDPITIGYKAVELAVKASEGEAVGDLDVPAEWYDHTNIEDDNISSLLYD